MTSWHEFMVAVIVLQVVSVVNGDLIPDKKCATLFSSANFEGDEYEVQHFDQFANLRKDYRASLNGFKKTKSAIVENGCALNLCNETYFLGTCQTLTSNSSSLGEFKPRSGNCTCPQECRCENVIIGKREFGRAYLNGNCNSCDVEYVQLRESDWDFSYYQSRVTGFILRSGCNLTVFSESNFTGLSTVLTIQYFQDFQGNNGSYKFSCDSNTYVPPFHHPSGSGPLLIELPPTRDKLLALQSKNESLSDHSGLLAALESSKSGRSSSIAYVVVFGTDWSEDAGFVKCGDVTTGKLSECRVPLTLDELGVTPAHLRVVNVPIRPWHNASYIERLMATLDEYLSAHEELNNTIPNAVILYHWVDSPYDNAVVRVYKRVLSSLRRRLLDENYSNLCILLDDLEELKSSKARQPESVLNKFENEITINWTFPYPVTVLTKVNRWYHFRYENGFRRMPNGEYWPLSLQASLINLCKKGHDPLGQAIFKKYFQTKEFPEGSLITKSFTTVPADHPKVANYRNFAAKPFPLENSTFRNIKKSRLSLQTRTNDNITMEVTGRNLNQSSCQLQAQCQCVSKQEIDDLKHDMEQRTIELSKEKLAREEDSKRISTELIRLNNVIEEDRKIFLRELQKMSADLENEKRLRLEESLKIITEIWKQIRDYLRQVKNFFI